MNNTNSNLNGFYKHFTDEACWLVDGKYASVFIPSADGVFKRTYTTYPKLYSVVPRKQGETAKVFQNNTFSLRDGEELAEDHPLFRSLKIGTDLSMAVAIGKEPVMVLSVLSKRSHKYSNREVKILNQFSAFAASSIVEILTRQKLERLIEKYNTYLNKVAEELRTPMAVIYAYTQALDRSIKCNEKLNQEHIEKILRHEKKLSQMINDLICPSAVSKDDF